MKLPTPHHAVTPPVRRPFSWGWFICLLWVAAPAVAAPHAPIEWGFDTGLSASTAPSTRADAGAALAIGTGVRWRGSHAHVGIRTAMIAGSAAEERIGVQTDVFVGAPLRAWLDVDGVISHRISATAVLAPWLTQRSLFGVQATQCLPTFEYGRICAQERLGLGWHWSRADVANERIQPRAQTSRSIASVDLGLLFRMPL